MRRPPNTTKTARLTSIVRSVPTRSKVHDHVQPFYSDARPGRYAASAAWHERARRQGPISEEIRSRLSETGRDPAYRLRGAGVSPHRRRLKSGALPPAIPYGLEDSSDLYVTRRKQRSEAQANRAPR